MKKASSSSSRPACVPVNGDESPAQVAVGLHDDQAVLDAGYIPQLKRSLGSFASFAIPFSEISITTGIFANFGFVLEKAGPFGFWTWPLVAAGQFLVALVFAEMAGRVPLTGSCYNWNNKLANPAAGWFTGWLGLFAFTNGVAAVTATMIPVLGAVLGRSIDPQAGTFIAAGLIAVQMLINLYGARLTSHTNIIAVLAEIIGIVGLIVLIVFAMAGTGQGNTALLTTIPAEPRPYWPGFFLSSLLGAWTMIGFECSADVSEEIIDARRIAPKAIIQSLLVSAVVGFVFIVVMVLAIPDLAQVGKAPYPLAAIVSHYWGDKVTGLFLVCALVAMFACALVCMMAGSRILFAMARDGRFVAAPFFSSVSSHHVPRGAILFVGIGSIVLSFVADNATFLYGAGTVCAVVYYLITVISFAKTAPRLPVTDTFALGRWHWPVVVLAALWLLAELGMLTVPAEFHPVAMATGAVMAVGVVLYFIIGRVRKDTA